MAHTPRPSVPVACAHCGRLFCARHARALYCTRSCNVRASHARNGRSRPARPAPVPAPVPVAVAPPVARPFSLPLPEVAARAALAAAVLAAAVLVERVRHPAPPTPREVLARQLCRALAQIYPPRAA